MAKAIGLGGVFIHMKGKSKELFDWYEEYLGLDFSAYGTGFLSGQQLMTLTFKRDDSDDMPYLNFRVDDLEEMVDRLKKDGIEITSDIEVYPYGSFARFKDPFGNPVELWQAKEEEYKTLVEEEIKKYKKDKTPLL